MKEQKAIIVDGHETLCMTQRITGRRVVNVG